MSYQLIDTHCHINFRAFKDDTSEVIARALTSKIAMIAVGSQTDTSKSAIELAEKYEGIWAAVGLHPNHLHEQKFIDNQELEANSFVKTRSENFDLVYYEGLVHHPKVVAIGEFGLDYYRMPKNIAVEKIKGDQKKAALKQISLATLAKKPIIVHCREAHSDQYELLKTEIEKGNLKERGVIHCFTGTSEEALKYIELGFMISVTGILTFSQELQTVVKQLPLSSIMIETDAPYLSPIPHRGKRNEPIYVKCVAETLADLKNVSFDEVAETTTRNAEKLFHIDLL